MISKVHCHFLTSPFDSPGTDGFILLCHGGKMNLPNTQEGSRCFLEILGSELPKSFC